MALEVAEVEEVVVEEDLELEEGELVVAVVEGEAGDGEVEGEEEGEEEPGEVVVVPK